MNVDAGDYDRGVRVCIMHLNGLDGQGCGLAAEHGDGQGGGHGAGCSLFGVVCRVLFLLVGVVEEVGRVGRSERRPGERIQYELQSVYFTTYNLVDHIEEYKNHVKKL